MEIAIDNIFGDINNFFTPTFFPVLKFHSDALIVKIPYKNSDLLIMK